MVYSELQYKVDIDRLVNDVEHITKNIPYKSNQIALQYVDVEDWYAGVGKSDTLSNDEQKFVHYHSELEGTYIKELLCSMPFPVAHARIMNLPPKTCYTTHVDYYTRFHIPVISKPLQTYMHFPDKETTVRMYPGKVYWTNTHELHNFLNGTRQDRIHIVFNNAEETKNLNNPYLEM